MRIFLLFGGTNRLLTGELEATSGSVERDSGSSPVQQL
jgi:hypothetical protein